MGLFSTILEKLGLGKNKEVAATKSVSAPAPVKPAAKPKEIKATGAEALYVPSTKPAAPAKSAPMEMVDVVSKLDKLAAKNPQKLNWKTSIVDLLKLLDIDSSLKARKELATELGCPPDLMGGDSSKMNQWLHKTVLRKISENGGNIPPELLS